MNGLTEMDRSVVTELFAMIATLPPDKILMIYGAAFAFAMENRT